MINANNPEINVEELKQRIRAEGAQRKAASCKAESRAAVENPLFSAGVEFPAFTLNLPELSPFAVQSAFQAKADGLYHVNDLLCYHDRAFVNVAYRTILHRSPDTVGYQIFLNMLRNGFAKVDILGRLRYSKEGRSVGAKISGLTLPFLLQRACRTPVFGRFVQVLSALWYLPRLERNQRMFENHTISLMEQTQSHFSETCRTLNKSFTQLEQAIRQLQHFAAPRVGQAAINEAHDAILSRIQKSMDELQNTKAGLDSIEFIKGHIQGLQNSKANQDDLNTAIGNIQQSHQDAFSELQNTKAGLDSIEVIKGHIQELQNSKANQDDLNTAIGNIQQSHQDAFSELQNTKAGLDSIEVIKVHIQGLQNSKANQDDLSTAIGDIQQSLQDAFSEIQNTKAGLDSIEVIKGHMHELQNSKANQDDLNTAIGNIQQSLKDAFSELQNTKAGLDAIEFIKGHIQELQNSKANQLALDEALLPLKAQAHNIKRNLLDQDRRLGLLLDEARRRLPKVISTKQIETMLTEDDHRLDAMYASFEDRFRGTREDIKQRQSIYLPIVLEAKAGTKNAPILDLGCGRGEWLEFLHNKGLTAKGVDINRIFLEGCRELGLDVVERDVVVYLQSLKPNSIGAVTSFHLIEHLSLKTLIALMDETLRVLQPGGVVILETPNPANVQVGSCNFYFDPTHRKPLPGPMTQYLLEARGFSRTQFMPLHPFGETLDRLTEGTPQIQRIFNQFFFGPQDYAVLAYKT